MGLSYEEYNFDKIRESDQASLIQGSREEMEMQLIHDVENEVEFWPVEHPLEPQDEDRPVKCPIPTSSLINDGRIGGERCAESLRKRPVKKEGIVIVDAPEAPPRAVRKRHHTLTNGDHVIMPSTRRMSSLPPHNVTIFQMLQQLDEFES